MNKMFFILLLASASCSVQKIYPTIGNIERLDESINDIVSANAKAEIIAEGFEWSEGPLWIEKNKMLLFSDIPRNAIEAGVAGWIVEVAGIHQTLDVPVVVVVLVRRIAGVDAHALELVVEDEVDHAGDGIGSVHG